MLAPGRHDALVGNHPGRLVKPVESNSEPAVDDLILVPDHQRLHFAVPLGEAGRESVIQHRYQGGVITGVSNVLAAHQSSHIEALEFQRRNPTPEKPERVEYHIEVVGEFQEVVVNQKRCARLPNQSEGTSRIGKMDDRRQKVRAPAFLIGEMLQEARVIPIAVDPLGDAPLISGPVVQNKGVDQGERSPWLQLCPGLLGLRRKAEDEHQNAIDVLPNRPEYIPGSRSESLGASNSYGFAPIVNVSSQGLGEDTVCYNDGRRGVFSGKFTFDKCQ